MSRSVTLVLILLLCSSCQKKKTVEPAVQRQDNYVPSATLNEIDTTLDYISPSDALNDRSMFANSNFQSSAIQFRGARNIYYQVSQPGINDLTIVVEYLNGSWQNGDTISTATRILIYSKNELLYRKAFLMDFLDRVNFSTIRKFDYSVMPVSAAKSLVYFWFTVFQPDGSTRKEYHAIGVNIDGVSNDLTGDIIRIDSNYSSVRFVNENRLKAKVPPNVRYPYFTVDIFFSVDWKTCTAMFDVPVDTIFTISQPPSRMFNSKTKLHTLPMRVSPFRETNFRRSTKATIQRAFAPSFFDVNSINRDLVFIEFNRTTKGWIDYESMLFEKIISGN